MAGNEGTHGPSHEGAPHHNPPKVKTFSCTHCGASVSLRNPQSLSVVCDSCHVIIDTADENYRILQTYSGIVGQFTPQIELGSRGELFGKKWELIGYIAREESGSGYLWEEYLLFNPYQGYRWLTCSSDHWSFVTPIKEKPVTSYNGAHYKGRKFRLFDRGPAKNVFILGEFYWKVAQDHIVQMDDYICPPDMLSCEMDQKEINWSLGTYVEPKVIKAAFKSAKLNTSVFSAGFAPNQPSAKTEVFNKMLGWWMFFLVALTAIEIGHLCTCSNHLAFHDTFTFIPNTKSQSSTTTPVFTLDKDQANVSIKVGAEVDNSWFYLGGELVNNENGIAYPLERSVEYYHGSDSDGSWSEGGNTNQFLISSVPGGKYYIDFEYESGGFSTVLPGGYAMGVNNDRAPKSFNISVWRDVSTYSNYFWCLFLVSILPLLYWIGSYSDEASRWSNSDYSPYRSSS